MCLCLCMRAFTCMCMCQNYTFKTVATAELLTSDSIQREVTSALAMHSIHKIHQVSWILASLCQKKEVGEEL